MADEIMGGDISEFPVDLQPEPELPLGELETPTIQEGEAETPKTESVSKEKFEEIDKARRVFYEKSKKLEAELERLKGKPEAASNPTVASIKLGKKLEKFSEDEIDFILDYAKSDKPEDILKAAENEMVKLAIEAKRKKVADENKIPASSTSGGSFDKSYRDIQKMSRAEHEKFVREQSRKNRGVGM